ncbi:MAG: hypothetical protein DRN04_11225 [Thermoprotei archaeon]|nr:MAG: hypothetical protein DRN04_11225 [Thermoprotei archaeon]
MPKTLADDLDLIMTKLDGQLDHKVVEKLEEIKTKLVEMWMKGFVKSNHSVMEFIIAKYLLNKGMNVEVEKELEESLVCDIYAEKDGLKYIVEIETGFVPPSNSVDPVNYRRAREISKIARYSKYADIFILATPPYHILQIPYEFTLPSSQRNVEELKKIKMLLDNYYKSPPISLDELIKAKIDYIYIINVDELKIIEVDAVSYYCKYVKNIFSSEL